MADITILGVLGNAAGTRQTQICLAHGFGDGGEQSDLLTEDAVSKLLLGAPIDYYVSMNLDGISTLNDALGGVEVTLTDDFTAQDPAMVKGVTLTLRGMQAEYYVRSRMEVGNGTNEARMQRQQTYLAGVREILNRKIAENGNFVGELFDALQDDLTTDMKRGRMINLAWGARDYSRQAVTQLAGEHVIGTDGFMEFRPDADKLAELVLSIFYEQLA